MEADWPRLADFIRSEMGHKRWSQRDLARESGVSERTISDLLSGRPRKWLPRTMSQIEIALGWPAGRTSDILAGAAVDEGSSKRRTVTYDEFRALLMLLRQRIENEPNASDADRARWRARVAELEADMLGDSDQRAS